MEHSVPDLPTEETPSLWKETFVLTEGEILHALLLTDPRRKSKLRILIESGVLGLATLYFFIGYITSDKTNTTPLVMTLACLFVLGMLLFAPRLQAISLARRAAKNQQEITLRGYDAALGFGEGDAFSTCSFREFSVTEDETMLVLQFQAGRMLVVPRRAVEESTWDWLRKHTT